MEDKELHQHTLGLKTPWLVRDVKHDLDLQPIGIHVEPPVGTKFCWPSATSHFRVATVL